MINTPREDPLWRESAELTFTLTLEEWMLVAAVIGSAVDLSMAAGRSGGGMPPQIAEMTQVADKFRVMLIDAGEKWGEDHGGKGGQSI